MKPHSAPSPKARILIIGAGFIANEYAKALQAMGCKHIGVLSRREESAKKLATTFGLTQAYGGGEQTLPQLLKEYDAFIVATPVETLKSYAELLAKAGAKKVLLEKPSFLFSDELADFLKRHPGWNAAVALNRLYYPSIEKMRAVIAEEGVTSVEFSFTEWVHRITPSDYTTLSLERWGLSNCIHVIATVFDMIGLPKSLSCLQHGKETIAWHRHGSIFMGHGLSENNIPFAYQSDWNSAGRWWITIRTPRGSYSLCPMEGIDFTAKGSVNKEVFMPAWNEETKCGFVPMLAKWLNNEPMVSLKELLPHMRVIEQIFGYAPRA